MNTPTELQTALNFVSQILSQDIIPAVNDLSSSAPSVDISPILASLLTVETSLNDLDTLVSDSFANIPKSLFLEYVVSANCTSVNLGSFFDINAHKSYLVEIDFLNASASASSLSFYINSDLVATNYYCQAAGGAANAYTGARGNNGVVLASIGSGRCTGRYRLGLLGGYSFMTGIGTQSQGSSIIVYKYAWNKISTVSNITNLTLVASVANSIKAGSVIRIYRGDV